MRYYCKQNVRLKLKSFIINFDSFWISISTLNIAYDTFDFRLGMEQCPLSTETKNLVQFVCFILQKICFKYRHFLELFTLALGFKTKSRISSFIDMIVDHCFIWLENHVLVQGKSWLILTSIFEFFFRNKSIIQNSSRETKKIKIIITVTINVWIGFFSSFFFGLNVSRVIFGLLNQTESNRVESRWVCWISLGKCPFAAPKLCGIFGFTYFKSEKRKKTSSTHCSPTTKTPYQSCRFMIYGWNKKFSRIQILS